MKSWFLGKEVPYFKPLKSELDKKDIYQLKISSSIESVNEEEIYSNLYNKGFLDPNFPNYIRTSSQLFYIDNLEIKAIFNTKEIKNFDDLPKKEVLPSHFVDFIKENKLISNVEREGFSIYWMEEDLRYTGVFKSKKGNDSFIFETEYFIYEISDKYEIIDILHKRNNISITAIKWSGNLAIMELIDSTIIQVEGVYAEWIYNLVSLEQEKAPKVLTAAPINESGGIYDEHIRYNFHPEIINVFKLDSERELLFKELIEEDIQRNGIVEESHSGKFLIKGWKFRYIWSKGVLETIELPAKTKVQEVSWLEDLIVINKKVEIPRNQATPLKITDLYVGNRVSILPENSLNFLEFHPHAVQRYTQRIDSKAFLSQMLKDVIYNSYYYGEVVEGAHTSDRRKVETNQFGYVISDDLVISVWDKLSSKRKK